MCQRVRSRRWLRPLAWYSFHPSRVVGQIKGNPASSVSGRIRSVFSLLPLTSDGGRVSKLVFDESRGPAAAIRTGKFIYLIIHAGVLWPIHVRDIPCELIILTQEKSNTFLDLVAFTIHRIVRVSNVTSTCFFPTGSFHRHLGQANRSDHPLRHFSGRRRHLFRTGCLFPCRRSAFRAIPDCDIMPYGARKRDSQAVLRPPKTALGVDQVAEKGHGLGEGRRKMALDQGSGSDLWSVGVFNTGFILPVVACSISRNLVLLPVPWRQGAPLTHNMGLWDFRDGGPHAPHRIFKNIPRYALCF